MCLPTFSGYVWFDCVTVAAATPVTGVGLVVDACPTSNGTWDVCAPADDTNFSARPFRWVLQRYYRVQSSAGCMSGVRADGTPCMPCHPMPGQAICCPVTAAGRAVGRGRVWRGGGPGLARGQGCLAHGLLPR